VENMWKTHWKPMKIHGKPMKIHENPWKPMPSLRGVVLVSQVIGKWQWLATETVLEFAGLHIQQDWATLNFKIVGVFQRIGWKGWKATQMHQSHLLGQNRSQHRLGQNPIPDEHGWTWMVLGTQVKTSRLYHSRFERFLRKPHWVLGAPTVPP
jgi:hypothetical protein